MAGFIKLYRDIITKDIYVQDPLYLRVFERLIIEANYRCKRIPYNKTTRLIKRGERLTSIRQIAEWVGWYKRGIFKIPNPKTIAEILNWLIKNDIIEIYNKGNSQETHYNIVNYCIYQSKDDDGSNGKVTVDGSVDGSVDGYKQEYIKKLKKEENQPLIKFFELFWKAYPKKRGRVETLKVWNKINIDDNLLNIILTAVEKQKKTSDWTKDNGQFIPYPATWLNGKRWEDEIETGMAPLVHINPIKIKGTIGE